MTTTNAEWIIMELKKSKDFDEILEKMLIWKPEYGRREHGSRILMTQIKGIYDACWNPANKNYDRFHVNKRLTVDTKTGLVIDDVEQKTIWDLISVKNPHYELLGKVMSDLHELDTKQMAKVATFVHNMVYENKVMLK